MKKLNILVIDGQGGRIGKQIIEGLKQTDIEADITAVGTNSIATSTMLKAGAEAAATGENAVIVSCRHADIIAGPVGIVIADSLLGEITPAMAVAVGQSGAVKFLIPVNQCNNNILGVENLSTGALIKDLIDKIRLTAMDRK
jgi:hypothetical protein